MNRLEWDGPRVFGGRTFSVAELELIRETVMEFAALGVTEIARTVCELLEWKRPNGGLKNLCEEIPLGDRDHTPPTSPPAGIV